MDGNQNFIFKKRITASVQDHAAHFALTMFASEKRRYGGGRPIHCFLTIIESLFRDFQEVTCSGPIVEYASRETLLRLSSNALYIPVQQPAD
jgi:hypothetical protein